MPSLGMCLEALIDGGVLCTRRYRDWMSKNDAKEASTTTRNTLNMTDGTENSEEEM